jgi:hypothetical protein
MHSAVEVFWTCMQDCCCPNCFSVWFLCFSELGSIFLLFAYICHKLEISIAFIVFSKLVYMWWNSRTADKVICWLPCTVRMVFCNIWLSIEILLYDVLTLSLPLPLPLPFPHKWFFWTCDRFVPGLLLNIKHLHYVVLWWCWNFEPCCRIANLIFFSPFIWLLVVVCSLAWNWICLLWLFTLCVTLFGCTHCTLPSKFWGCQLHVHYVDTGMVIKHENFATCQNPLKKH